MVMMVSNVNDNKKLKLDMVLRYILNEEAKQKVSEDAKSSGNALSVEARGRDNSKEKL